MIWSNKRWLQKEGIYCHYKWSESMHTQESRKPRCRDAHLGREESSYFLDSIEADKERNLKYDAPHAKVRKRYSHHENSELAKAAIWCAYHVNGQTKPDHHLGKQIVLYPSRDRHLQSIRQGPLKYALMLQTQHKPSEERELTQIEQNPWSGTCLCSLSIKNWKRSQVLTLNMVLASSLFTVYFTIYAAIAIV